MELPSMVQRSGDTLIVRSVVSGNQLYMDNNVDSSVAQNSANNPLNSNSICSTSALEQQLECYRAAAQQQEQQYQLQMQQQQQQHNANQQLAAMELREEGLPQCKIKRNYSCSYCTYFTQNPRYHLTHLRDVHGEKIVINKCKLCLYASRHFQKLVRHMKMVHGCTEGIPGQPGQTRKRGMNREARKRKLEQSAVNACVSSPLGATTSAIMDLSSMEQTKRDLQLQDQHLRRDVLAFNKQQQEEKQRQQQLQQSTAEAIFVAAYERQLQAQREIEVQQQKEPRDTYETATAAAQFQVPPSQHHHEQVSNKSLDVVPPSDSNSPPTPGLSIAPVAYNLDQEPVQNRLIKCSVCDFTTLYRSQLVDHELEEHCKTKFFRCEKCSYVTHIKARFSKHVKYHSMPMIKCVTCDFRTPYKWNLDRHMKNHGGAGPFKCAACDFTADIKQSLTVHEMNHHVPPVGHAAGMSLARRRNKVGGTDLSDDFLSDSAELLEDQFNNNNNSNNIDDYEEVLADTEAYGKRGKYEDEVPTDLSQKGGSSDTSSVHNQSIMNGIAMLKYKRPLPSLIPIPKISNSSVLNLSKDLAASRSSLTDIASMFFNDKQLSEMLQPLDKSDAAQLSPTTTSTSSQHSRSLTHKKLLPGGSIFDTLKLSALTPGGPCENLICPCGHMAKCLSESIIHRKSCNFAAITTDDDIEEEEEQDDVDGRLEIDFDEDDKQSHSALNLSVTGSTRCQHCRHRCKSSADLLNHLKGCSEAGRCVNDSYDSLSGESSSAGRLESCGEQHLHPMENRVFVWNKMPSGNVGTLEAKPNEEQPGGSSSSDNGGTGPNGPNNDDNSYYGVETAPGYGEVTKKMTPEEEAANSCLKKVYKCPHCSFWASTASRFHVHIVGHLNKKPFECSLCSYRSNWRWDITKHIRLKTIRDPSHKSARVLMNDETGRRNYTKYNKYITLMKVTEEDGDPKLMKSGEMTPNQVASLAFLNDFKKNVSNGVNALNGIKDDVTLEPITATTTPPKSSHAEVGDAAEVGAQIPENFMHLPFIATAMLNAASMVQQQAQQDQQHVTMITPSVTISAVKRSTPPSSMAAPMKPSDDLITDVKQEGNERKTSYKCRRCTFRHTNRDAVLAHVRIHYQDYPIVTATAMTSESSSKEALQHQQQHNSPLQVAVNSNLYMNKVFAAMCLSQQQQQNQNSANNTAQAPTGAQQQHQQQPQHSILSAGLLQQAIQGTSSSSPSTSSITTPNTAISGLALALTGKKGSATATSNAAGATSILEHGEQNASQNEASSSLSALSTGALLQPHATNSSCLQPLVRLPHQQHSLQHLLTSPRGTNQRHSPHGGGPTGNNKSNNRHNHNKSHNHHNSHNNHNNNNNTFNNNNLVMGLTSTPATAATICSPNSSSLSNTSPSPNSSQQSATVSNATGTAIATTTATVTTLPTANSTPTTSSFNHSNTNSQKGSIGASSSLLFTSASSSNSNHNSTQCVGAGASGSGIYGGVVHGSYSNNSSSTTTTTTTIPTTTPTTSCNLLLNTATANANATTSNTKLNSNNLLTNDNERRDPSPYRCGHCHQVSNWKHVIQRHCRLKHAGDIRIETLDRSSTNEMYAPPRYRSIGNSATNETNAFGATLKALQQQQQQQQNTSNQSASNENSITNNLTNNNNNNVLMSKAAVDQLMLSPLATNTNNATPQAIQAAATAAYFAAAYQAAAANISSANNGQNVATAEDLLLQQQLQQNEQIEITRLPSNNSNVAQNSATSSLAQLLEHSATTPSAPSALHSQQNSKCKQQKCPLCPYISESKSQMNYHISLHKPTQYECGLCSFVCAKKQHLSSHTRSVHQQHAVAAAAAASAPAPNGGLPNLDFSVALQFAAAAQAKQDPIPLQAPLAVDLSALKSLAAGNCTSFLQKQQQQPQQQQLSNEFHLFKFVSYCAKCPARFYQKAHDAITSTEFQDHLKAHQFSNPTAYKCEFCDFKAPHETLLQTHRFVHTAKYQEKCNELVRNCKEDPEHPAPKLMQIALNKHIGTQTQVPMIWVVDNELGEQFKQQQNSSISSSSPSPYDNTNSLLKKQLESGPAPLPSMPRNSPSPKTGDEYSSAAPSTSASVATSDLAADAGSESGSMAASPASLEKCMHCPYETTNAHSYKAHLQHHVCVSQVKEAFSCEHCDYTDPEESQITEHTRVHFNAMEKLKTVAFFTSYDQLELSTERNDVEAEKMKNQKVDDNNSSSSSTGGNMKQHNIKQEHNNNNEENVANENTLQEMRDNARCVGAAEKVESNKNEVDAALLPPPAAVPTNLSAAKKASTKIILYKNDGCLSVKKDLMAPQVSVGGANSSSSSSERNNISDRLRRRISRSSSSSHLYGSDEQQSQQQSHKTILVNAKTGQVITRN